MTEKIMGALSKAHGYTSDKALQFFGGLFMEQKDEDGDGNSVWVASLGRVAFWIVFGHMLFVWAWQGQAPQESELSVFYALLAYNGGKIAKEAIVEGAGAFRGNGES